MDFRRRLEHLKPPVNPATTPSEHAPTLEMLRAKMAEILGRPVAPPRPPADPAATLLPFALTETPLGPLYARREVLPRSHHVGRLSVDAAAGAAAEMLALLALDPAIASIDPARALYIDTETTGLGTGSGVLAFLIGLAWFDSDGCLVMEQGLLRRPGQEVALLELLRERVEAASAFVSFNGKTFDLPLLATRYVMNRLPPLPPRPHLDLLHVARRLHRKRLKMCRLVHLEADVLGYVRGPDIEGGEVAARYLHFLRTGDEEALRQVIEHNALDVVSMAALVALYGEPLESLHDEDLTELARTFRRAKALDRAADAAERAVARAGGPDALRVRGEIAKARGDRARALADFEALSDDIDDPSVRLELAKLYEHHVRSPMKALALCEQGTGEAPEAAARRRARLERKRLRALEKERKTRDNRQSRARVI